MTATQQMPRPARRGARRPALDEQGFTLVELMIAVGIITAVMGATAMMATQIQQGYGTQLDDAAAEQEARYALDWIARDLQSAGSDPYRSIADGDEIRVDPNGGMDTDDSIRITADINPPDGLLGAGEDVVIAFDAANGVITRQDLLAVDPTAQVMTESLFTDVSFTLLDEARAMTASPLLAAFIQVQVTTRSAGRNAATCAFTASTLGTEVRLQAR